MSFRNRLTLFFVLIVIVPMVSVAGVLFALIDDNESGKADAQVAARQDVVIGLLRDARTRADAAALRIGEDPGVAAAIRARSNARLAVELEQARRAVRATRAVFVGAGVRADVGARLAVFGATRQIVDAGGRPVGRLDVAVQDATGYAQLVRRVTGRDVVIARERRVLAATLDGSGRVGLPDGTGDVEIGGTTYRAATVSTQTPDFGAPTTVTLLDPREQTESDAASARLLAVGILGGFLILAFTFAVLVSRSLQRQIDGFLDAARRLGRGDFSAEVPTQGRDEFAQLGGEFNRMSAQLADQLEELRAQRLRLELSLRRIGETFASNLDRDALLEIVVSTAVDGVAAAGGRALVLEEHGPREVARAGAQDGEALEHAVEQAEGRVLNGGAPADEELDGVAVLSHPLISDRRPVGLVTVWREGGAFGDGERDLLHYLARQAAVSIENVGLHRTVERQAMTDELTGLSNRRRFEEALGAEVERTKRFGGDVGLLMLDIDDFKRVNDRHGHQAGDVVLREVARVLRETAREIDEPARYGGEELTVVLPGTDLDGAFLLAERVRQSIEDLRVPIDGGAPLRVTASFGVASAGRGDGDPHALVAAADQALYEAKRTGKNRTVRATAPPGRSSGGPR